MRRSAEAEVPTAFGWYVQVAPGPSPFLFISSLSYTDLQPFRLHFVPRVTGASRSSSSSCSGSGARGFERRVERAICWGARVVENVSLPPACVSVTLIFVFVDGLAASGLGTASE